VAGTIPWGSIERRRRPRHALESYAATREEAERQKRAFQAWCTKRGQAEVGRVLDRD